MSGKKTFEDWLCKNFSHNELADLCCYGAVGGFSGITTYSETTALYDKYRDDIWTLLAEESECCGEDCLTMIAHFRGAKQVDSDATFKNLLVWYAAEQVAYQVTQGRYLGR